MRAGLAGRPEWRFRPQSRVRPVSTSQRRHPVVQVAFLAHGLVGEQNGAVSAEQIDQYLAASEEPKRTTLAGCVRRSWISCPRPSRDLLRRPGLQGRGKDHRGVRRVKNHLSYLPHSGSVFPQLKDELRGYSTSSGALRFGIGQPLPVPLVEKLIAVRLQQAVPG